MRVAWAPLLAAGSPRWVIYAIIFTFQWCLVDASEEKIITKNHTLGFYRMFSLLKHVHIISYIYYIIHLSGIARNFGARGKQCCREYFWCPEPIWILLALHWRPLAAPATSLMNLDPHFFNLPTPRFKPRPHSNFIYGHFKLSPRRAGVCHHGPYGVPSHE